jgi:hypothetical protein
LANERKALSLTWTRHIKDGEQKQKFEQALRASTTIVTRLQQILDEEEKALDKASVDFDNPSWSHKQAFILGQKDTLRKLKELVDFI